MVLKKKSVRNELNSYKKQQQAVAIPHFRHLLGSASLFELSVSKLYSLFMELLDL